MPNIPTTVKVIKPGEQTMRDTKVVCPQCKETTWILSNVTPFPDEGEIDCCYCGARLAFKEIEGGGV